MLDLLLVAVFSCLGVAIGVVTGLLPGLHVNNVALILLSLTGGLVTMLGAVTEGCGPSFPLVLVSCIIISISVAHSFTTFVTSVFIGAPDEGSALSILPAHRMLLRGDGYKAVVLSALGSAGAILVCLAAVVPLRFVLGPPLELYETIRSCMVWILVAVVAIMIATEKGRVPELGETGKLSAVGGMTVAAGIMVLSGAFGFLIFDLSLSSPLGLPAPVLFPALAGLFGMPTLLTSLATTPALPHQDLTDPPMTAIDRKASVLSVLTGSGAGVFCALVPGLTTATGTVLAMVARRKASVEQTIVTLSAVNTAAAFTVVLVLFIALRTRSGVTIAVGELLAVEAWDGLAMPNALGYLLIAMVVAACLSFYSTLWLGQLFARHFHRIPYRALVAFAIGFVCVLVTAFTGLFGIGVLLIGTCIGLLPLFWGVRRSQCMGVLLLPIIALFL